MMALTFFSEVWVDQLRVETCSLRDCCRGHSELSEAAFSINEDELYSSISSYSMREKAVRELLTRHCQLLETPESWAKETFLTQKLCVPAEWIHEAKAVRAHMESDKHLEALYLFKAGHWNRCHKLVIRHLASGECFTRGPVSPGIRPHSSNLWTPWWVRPELMLSMGHGRCQSESDPTLKALCAEEAWPGWGASRAGVDSNTVIICQEYSWSVLC